MRRSLFAGALAAVLVLAGPAQAQLLGGGGLGQTVGGVTGELLGNPAGGQRGLLQAPLDTLHSTTQDLPPASLIAVRRDRLRQLVRDNRATLEVDERGDPVRRGEVVGLGLSPQSLAQAERAGFRIARSERIDGLGLVATTFAIPAKETARKALARLRALDAAGTYTLDHIYQPAGGALAVVGGPAAGGSVNSGATIGLIDGGIGAHPAFASARIEQRGFAGEARPSGHGTAVASLLVGTAGAFRGAAPHAALLAADVYGGSAANGSAVAIARAMGWLAQRGARVVNISLVGPPNALLEAGVKALTTRGVQVVAAVGNDGPAAPPQYPASYPGVIAVTGVDARNRALIEAGRPTHLDFAAPGADMVGALPGGGWEILRGTSFAAPLVAARLAARGSAAALAAEARPGSGKIGRGIVCGDCRTAPHMVGLK